jgi:hypothetical protein
MMPSGDWDMCSEVFRQDVEGMTGHAFEVYNRQTRRGRSLWFSTKKQAECARDRWIEFYLDCTQSKAKGEA